MTPVRVGFRPPRVYIFGHRIHHGFVGVLLVLTDLHDRRKWLSDFLRCEND